MAPINANGKQRTKIRENKSDVVYNVINTLLLIAVIFLVGYPLLYILSSSFSSTIAVRSGKVWLWPVEPTVYAYEVIFKYQKIWSGYLNSIIYTIVGTVLGVAVTICAAYPLSRVELKGRRLFNWIFLFTMLFNGGIVPTYLIIKNLGLLDSMWAIVLPGAVSAWNIIVMRTFFQNSIPKELIEAANIDGCTDFGVLWRIVIPLSGSIIAVITLFFAVWQWNSYFSALMYLQTGEKFPLQIILRDILIVNSVDPTMIRDIDDLIRKQGLAEVLRYSLIVVASAPLLLIYPFVQKYFIKGVMVGSIKG